MFQRGRVLGQVCEQHAGKLGAGDEGQRVQGGNWLVADAAVDEGRDVAVVECTIAAADLQLL